MGFQNWFKPTAGAIAFGLVMYSEIYVLEKTGSYLFVAMFSMACAAVALARARYADGLGRAGFYIFAVSSVLFSAGCIVRIIFAGQS
jgi:hypothetical protein